jgi:glycosyltransferase involved in cell wall biosynthesis
VPTKSAYRVAIVCSHPIQYLSPWFRHLAAQPELKLTVLYGDDHGLRAGFDPDFAKEFRWDVDLMSGYESLFLRNQSPRPGVGRFFGIHTTDLFALLEPRGFDAVVIQGWNYALYPLALFFAHTARLPVLLRCESVRLVADPGSARRSPLRDILKRPILRRYVGACAAGLAVSAANRRLLLACGMPPERIFSSPYAVDGTRFALDDEARQAARRRWRDRLGVSDDTPLLLFVGKLMPVKAPELLLQAFSALRARGVAAHLSFCGDGPLRESLVLPARRTDGVSFPGFVNQAELPALYAAADALVLPSHRETFGIVVPEAMHAGLPVVVSSGVGCAEDLVSPTSGLTFPAGDVSALTDCLAALCEGEGARDRRTALARGARARIATWTYTEATQGLIAALNALLQDGIR